MTPIAEVEIAVIGGGTVGVSIAAGLRRLGQDVLMLDEGDGATRASRGNFGLVWVQSKGDGIPIYTQWAKDAVEIWLDLADWLRDFTNIDVGLEQPGGLFLCRTEADLAARAAKMKRVAEGYGSGYRYEMLDGKALRRLEPRLGHDFAGGSYSPYDGQADPLRLFHALHRAYRKMGGACLDGVTVQGITTQGQGYCLETNRGTIRAERIVLASGLGNADLGRHLGVDIPVVPVKGQILVTERVPRLFNTVMEQVRQTPDGTLMIGGSWEEGAGFDQTTTYDVTRRIASDALAFFPFLERVSLVRSWSALRIISPDAAPIYDEVAPGAFLVTCHSGVSLAAVHLQDVAGWIAEGHIPDSMQGLGLQRFAA